MYAAAAAKLLQSCPTLCDPIDVWQPTRFPRPWASPGKNTGVGCHFLLQCMKVKSESESEVAQLCPILCSTNLHWAKTIFKCYFLNAMHTSLSTLHTQTLFHTLLSHLHVGKMQNRWKLIFLKMVVAQNYVNFDSSFFKLECNCFTMLC